MENTTLENVTATDGKSNVKTDAKSNAKTDAKPLYTVEQLAEGYKAFGTSRAIVECALKLSGKSSFTMDEARKVINAFKNRK